MEVVALALILCFQLEKVFIFVFSGEFLVLKFYWCILSIHIDHMHHREFIPVCTSYILLPLFFPLQLEEICMFRWLIFHWVIDVFVLLAVNLLYSAGSLLVVALYWYCLNHIKELGHFKYMTCVKLMQSFKNIHYNFRYCILYFLKYYKSAITNGEHARWAGKLGHCFLQLRIWRILIST